MPVDPVRAKEIFLAAVEKVPNASEAFCQSAISLNPMLDNAAYVVDNTPSHSSSAPVTESPKMFAI